MKISAVLAIAVLVASGPARAAGQDVPLPTPGFHHLELNSVDPDAAIAFYTKEFPSTSKTAWEGMPALASPDHVLIVFKKVAAPPDADPEATAYWHFGWAVTDTRAKMNFFAGNPDVKRVPFYTGDDDGSVFVSSDTYPYPPGVPGRTRAQIAEAKAEGLKPRGVGGNGYIYGPDHAIIEYAGNAPAERFDHVHMWEDQPLCAELWYEKHLNAKPRRQRAGTAAPTQADCNVPRGADRSWPSLDKQGTYRSPTAGVVFGDVAMNWYMNQSDKPLAPTQGHLMDHVALSVGDLDAWVAKLKNERVTFLRQPYRIGDTRAVMIEGPSHEAIELVEVK